MRVPRNYQFILYRQLILFYVPLFGHYSVKFYITMPTYY